MLLNYAYHLPVGGILLGAVAVLSGFVTLVVLYGQDQVRFRQRHLTHYMLGLCGLGAVSLVVGCCTCCTIYNRIQRNWNRLLTMQQTDCRNSTSRERRRLHAPTVNPIVSGYDPRFSAWTPLPVPPLPPPSPSPSSGPAV